MVRGTEVTRGKLQWEINQEKVTREETIEQELGGMREKSEKMDHR